MSVYLAIDLGTTGCRSILFDSDLKPLASSYEEYGLITPAEKYTEQDAELWWSLTLKTAKAAIKKAGIRGSEIKSISVSSQGITVVPVDKDIKPLCHAISWLDVRSEAESATLETDFGAERLFALTGKPASACYTLPKLMWLKAHAPQVYASAYKFLMPMDFLIARLCGHCVTDHSMASGTLLYDLKGHCWSRELLSRYGIEEARLPALAMAGERVGCVLPSVAQELGLSPDCTVALGAQDQKCAAYGVGLCDGVMTVSLGTAAAITKYWTEARTEQNLGVGWCGYVEKDAYVTEGVVNTAGTCLRWTRDMLYPNTSYDIIDKEADEALAQGSSVMFYPYMNGPSSPCFYPNSEGCFYGVNLATGRGSMALAVMEGIAFQFRILLEAMEAYGNVHTLVLFGGGARSAFWCQLIADITGMRIAVPNTIEAAGAGAARLAAKAVGEPLSPLSPAHVYLPSERTEAYNNKYKAYRAVEARLWQ